MKSSGLRGGLGGEEEVGALAGPGGAFFQVFSVEGGSDGVAELWTARFGERCQLHRVCFFSGSGRTAEAEREQRCKDSTAEYNCDCATH